MRRNFLALTLVGLLALGDSHRPEARSRLIPCTSEPIGARAPSLTFSLAPCAGAQRWIEPTRLLPAPLELGAVHAGALVAIEHALYAVDDVRLAARLDGVEWWTGSAIRRDYARVWLHVGARGSSEHACALVYREQGRWLLHGWHD